MEKTITINNLSNENDILLIDNCSLDLSNFVWDTYEDGSFSKLKWENLNNLEKGLEIGSVLIGYNNSFITEKVLEEYNDYLKILRDNLKWWNKALKSKTKNSPGYIKPEELNKKLKFENILLEENKKKKLLKRRCINNKDNDLQKLIFNSLCKFTLEERVKNKNNKKRIEDERYTDEEIVSTALSLAIGWNKKVGIISQDTDICKLLMYFCLAMEVNKKDIEIKNKLKENKIGVYSLTPTYRKFNYGIGEYIEIKKGLELLNPENLELTPNFITYESRSRRFEIYKPKDSNRTKFHSI